MDISDGKFQPLTLTVFCGICSRSNADDLMTLLWSLFMVLQQLCNKGGATDGNNSTLVSWEITTVSSPSLEIKKNVTLSVIIVHT